MKKQTIIGLAALAAVSAVGLQRSTAPVDEEVTGSYVSEDGKKTELLGVCSITEDKVDCWDGAGVRSEEINKRVLTYLSRDNGGNVTFRFGKKNRVVVMLSPPDGSGNFELPEQSGINTLYWGSDDKLRVSGVRVEANSEDKTVGLIASIPTKPVNAKLALKTGEKADVDGVVFEVGSIKPGKPPENRNMYDGYGMPQPAVGSYWSVILAAKPGDSQYYNLTFGAFDQDLKPIRYVDLKGEPISAVTYLALGGNPDGAYPGMRPPGAKAPPKPRCATVQIIQSTGVPGALGLSMNVNPEKVAYIVIGKPKQKRILFKDIPLDPKQ